MKTKNSRKKTKNTKNKKGGSVQQAIGDFQDAIKARTDHVINQVNEQVENVKDQVNKAKDKANEQVDNLKEQVSNAQKQAKIELNDVTEQTKNFTEKTRKNIVDGVADNINKVSDTIKVESKKTHGVINKHMAEAKKMGNTHLNEVKEKTLAVVNNINEANLDKQKVKTHINNSINTAHKNFNNTMNDMRDQSIHDNQQLLNSTNHQLEKLKIPKHSHVGGKRKTRRNKKIKMKRKSRKMKRKSRKKIGRGYSNLAKNIIKKNALRYPRRYTARIERTNPQNLLRKKTRKKTYPPNFISKGGKKTKKNRKGGARTQSNNFTGPESCETIKQNEMYTDCCNLDNEEIIRQLEESQELLTDARSNLRGCRAGRRNLERELRLRLPETKQEHRLTFQSNNVGHPRLVLVPPHTPSNRAPRFAARPRPGTAGAAAVAAREVASNNRTNGTDHRDYDNNGETKHMSGGG